MPKFVVHTNVPKDSIPKTFLTDASKLIASALSKPENYVTVRIEPDKMMVFGGTSDPCAHVELESIGNLGGEKNRALSKQIGDFLEKNIRVKPDRSYIHFMDVPGKDYGWNGSTFG